MKLNNRLALAVSIALLPTLGLHASALEKKETRKTQSRGQLQGAPGTWVQYYQDTYRWEADQMSIIRSYQMAGIVIEPADANKIAAKLESGELTGKQLDGYLAEIKSLYPCKADLGWEWNSRKWDLTNLRKNFGLVNGESYNNNKYRTVDDAPADYPGPQYEVVGLHAAAYQGKNNYDFEFGNRSSMISEASRLLRLSDLISMGIIPERRLNIQGFFTGDTMPASSFYKSIPRPISYNNTYSTFPWDINCYKIDIQKASAAALKEAAELIYRESGHTWSPIAFDLNNNGSIGVTGKSTARVRAASNGFVERGAVNFDIAGIGKPYRIEWMGHENDGLLVDDREGEVTKAARGDGVISGLQLFGGAGGYDNGYVKLAKANQQNRLAMARGDFAKVSTVIKGKDLEGLKVWIDRNGDAKVQPGELNTLESLGITAIDTVSERVKNRHGETLMQSSYIENGKKKLAEDIWFARDPEEK